MTDAAPSGESLASIAHEYNNVLTVIGGSVALAERHAAGNPALVRLLDNMRIAVERAVHLTERLSSLTGTAECAAEPAPAPPAACVLVVEDDPNVAAVAVAALEALDLRVVLATSAADALELLRTERVDAVFSDIVMPGGLSGLELARRLEVSHPGVPVLLATGFSREALGVEALRFAVLPKPYSVAELGRRIQQMMAAGA